jgi:hypothetical protein
MKTMLLFLLMLTSLRAATLTYTSVVPHTATDWTNTMTVPKFNVSGATLTAVTVEVQGYLTNRLSAESRSALTRTVTVTNTTDLVVTAPNLPTIQTTLTNGDKVALSPYDGVDDYAGASGFSVGADAEVDDEDNVTNLTPWVGGGTVNVVATAKATSGYSGPADYSFLTETFASACITVTYTYDEPCRPLRPRHKKHWRFRRDR